jgi:hypothetical protein
VQSSTPFASIMRSVTPLLSSDPTRSHSDISGVSVA